MLYNLFHSPTLFVKSSRKGAVSDSEPSCPLSQPMRFSVVGQESRFACVLALLHSSRPFAIRWPSVCNTLIAVSARIISVVVFALYAVVAGRFLAHVRHEVDKGVKPTFANHYSASSVAVVVLCFWVVAAFFHVFPRVVFWRLVPASGACSVTTAGLDRLLSKIASRNCGCISTLTLALPARIARLGVASKLDHCELAVFAANFVRAVFAASAGMDVSRPSGTCAKNLLDSAFTAKQPVRSVLATKFGTGVAYRDEIAEWLSSDVFDVGRQLDRIVRRHSSTPRKLDCDIEPERYTTTALARFILA